MSAVFCASPTLIGLAVILTPAAARACGGCVDAIARERIWWADLGLWLSLFLILDHCVFWASSLAGLRAAPRPSWRRFFVALGVAVLVSFGFYASPVAFGGAFSLLLLGLWGAQLRGCGPRVRWIRSAALVLGAVGALWAMRPAGRSVDALLNIVTAHTAGIYHPGGWVETELKRRPAAVAQLETRLGAINPRGKPTLPTYHAIALLRLHKGLGGTPRGRLTLCAGLGGALGWDCLSPHPGASAGQKKCRGV